MASEIKVDTIVNAGGDNDTGIDLSVNDVVAVKTANSERMRINSSGAVMIGTTSSPNNAPLLIHCATDDNIRINQETHATISGVNDAANAFVTLKLEGNELLLNSQSQNNVLIGCTALPSDSVGGAGFEDAGDDRMILNLSTTTTSSRNQIVFRNPNNAVGTINTSGTTTGYNTSSDYRLKENVVTDWNATTRLKQLKPSQFNFKADKDTTVDGFLAHEVQSIVPVAITGEKDEVETYTDDHGKEQLRPVYQGIDQSKLVPLLTKALQEAIAKIETLEAKVIALESK